MGLKFLHLEMNGLMISNNFSLRMTPLYHLVLSRIAFKKKNGFIAKKLSNYISVSGGEDVYAKDYSFNETDYVYLSTKNIESNEINFEDDNTVFINKDVGDSIHNDNRTLKENDIIVTRSGTIGITVLIRKEMLKEKKLIPSGYVKVLRTNNEILPKFLTYYLNNPIIRELMEIGATGKNQKNLSNEIIRDLPFPSILPDDQMNVLRVIEEKEKRIKELKKNYKSEKEVINNVFSKFLRYEEKITDKGNYKKEVLFSDIKDRFIRTDPDHFMFLKNYTHFLEQNKNTEFLELKEFIEEYESGKPIERSDYSEVESDYIHIVPRDIKSSFLNIKNAIFLNYIKGESLKDFRCESGDILLVLSSNVGEAVLFNKTDKKYTISHYIAKLRVRDINKNFLVYYFYYRPIEQYFRAMETGKDQKNLAQYYIFHLKVPNMKNQEEIVKEIENNLEKNHKIFEELISLKREIHEIFWDELHKYTNQKK